MDYPASRELVPELVVRESSPSTNAELADRARREELPSYTTVVTTDQTAGRGRLGRSWIAPAGSAIAASVLVVPRTAAGPLSLDRFGWLPIAAGIAVTQTVAEALPAASTGFKWPNDVVISGRKVCGVLAELLPERGAVVIGAGINLAMTARQLPVDTATSLAIEGAPADLIEPDTVLAGYLGRFRRLVEQYLEAGGDAEVSGLAALARSLCITLGRVVRVELPDGTVLEGTATALDADGRLVVRGADGAEHTVAAGDVTHARHVDGRDA
ncbi:MAG TPA: biotin--[acetyl-CoA-carboxylase] ligase [Solirubrobacteraceae bacterium]|nr:biotin--[acetyl-CoA-carboxylase] ligase [Solirubrobacteraceae bacterium]